MPLGVAAGNLVALLDADEQIRDLLEREANATDQRAGALLGLAPAGQAAPRGRRGRSACGTGLEVDAALSGRARPIGGPEALRALRAGYESGDQELRQAVLAQSRRSRWG